MPDPGDSRRFPASQSCASEWLNLDIVDEGGNWGSFGPVSDVVQAAGKAVACHGRFAGRSKAVVCLALSDDSTVRDLNARYRGKDRATNVLSFPALAGDDMPQDVVANLGDVILAYETVDAEAREQGIPPGNHLQHLVVHGLLHLLGFDHEEERAAQEMEGLEIEILASLSIANPYADADVPRVDDAAPLLAARHG